ncbi:hypothetical protein BpHYR1_025869 [Brachionus plicatilis]|uniref:Uncharacterized protein n=1 Tax=Brachionus plicatilis TaxID=10195 RepID=A0A3M7PRZ7_BRAPC|nr:hypothetical protein BpHYR1_025869 [Brachionus plicatilis]
MINMVLDLDILVKHELNRAKEKKLSTVSLFVDFRKTFDLELAVEWSKPLKLKLAVPQGSLHTILEDNTSIDVINNLKYMQQKKFVNEKNFIFNHVRS